MTAAKRPTPENKPSYLLSHDENRQLFNLIGTKCKSLASAVVQVYFADPPGRNQWNKRYCGVICFIKDNIKRSYFLRGKNLQFLSAIQEDTTLYYLFVAVFCMDSQTTLWEQELYSTFEYLAPRPYFHTFEGDVTNIFYFTTNIQFINCKIFCCLLFFIVQPRGLELCR
jgi:Wiskott-Aldrich syndrome protein